MDSSSKQYRCMHSSYVLTTEPLLNLGRHELKGPRATKHCGETGGKPDENVKSDYGRQPSDLEERPYDVICQENGFPSRAAEVPTIIK